MGTDLVDVGGGVPEAMNQIFRGCGQGTDPAAGVEAWATAAGMPGNDPYDALRSPRLPALVRSFALGRQLAIQLRRRCPLDLSLVLRIAPFRMAKAQACAVSARARALGVGIGSMTHLQRAVEGLLSAEGGLGGGRWGYEFDVQTRWAYYPAGTPNAIAGFFASRALAEAALEAGRDDWLAAAVDGARYASECLVRESPFGRFFSYTPDSDVLIHNANLLTAGMTCVLGRLSSQDSLIALGAECANTSSKLLASSAEGWPYGVGDSLAWCDSFHTAYDLDGLHLVWLVTRDPLAWSRLEQGTGSWVGAFFGPAGQPAYNADGSGPCDIHAAATAVDVGVRLSASGLCEPSVSTSVAAWTEANLIDARECRTYYRKGRFLTDRRHFVRWGDAHWAVALASLAVALAGRTCRLETEAGRLSRQAGQT